MARVRIADGTAPWMAPRDGALPDETADDDGLIEVDPESSAPCARFHHPGSESDLQLFEVRMPPDSFIEPHAHRSDEIVYVLDGELRLGARVLRSGSSVYIPGRTLYALRAGSEGARFLNFRSSKDLSYLTKDELMVHRRGDVSSLEDG